MKLPRSDRFYLATKLIESLDDDKDLSSEWKKEIAERIARREAGETQHVSSEQVHQDIQRMISAS